MQRRVIPPREGQKNLVDYEEVRKNFSFREGEKFFTWSRTGKANIIYEALEKHVDEGRGDSPALYYSDGQRRENYTFAQLAELARKFTGVLRSLDFRKGERLAIFLPRSPEWYVTFAGTVRAGGIVVPLFEAFMEEALYDRLADSGARILVTAPELLPRVPLERLPQLEHVIVTGEEGLPGTLSWQEEMMKATPVAEVTWVDLEDPYLILYASGAEGVPRGIVHVHYGMVGHYLTAYWVHDLRPGDVYWCTADPGWITGIVYGFLAPWMHGVPVVIRGGRFRAEDWYRTLAEYRVSVWYSAPTAFRMMRQEEHLLTQYDLSSLRHILSVGEPLTEDVLNWCLEKLGLPVYDTWWMTETGMNIICQLPALPLKVGSIGKPLPGIECTVLDDEGREVGPNRIGHLAIKKGWPAMFRAVWNNEEKYREYFRFDPWFVSGDAAYYDEDGYFYFQGRVDGVINTSGERVGPAEVEKKLVEHPAVKDAAVAGKPDPLRGEIVKAYVVLEAGRELTAELMEELRNFVKTGLAAHAAPREFEAVGAVPRTADGSIDRKKLREWVLGLSKPD